MHPSQPTLTLGADLTTARAAVILAHGRGASAQSMAELAAHLPTDGIAYLLPQAANSTWWPGSGFAPIESNQPWVDSALQVFSDLITRIHAAGLTNDQIILGGFSQGAVLASEYAARHATRYGGLLIFSGAVLGPLTRPLDFTGSFANTPAFIGGQTNDPWVNGQQLQRTADLFTRLGAHVTTDIIPGADHTIRPSELEQAIAIVRALSTQTA